MSTNRIEYIRSDEGTVVNRKTDKDKLNTVNAERLDEADYPDTQELEKAKKANRAKRRRRQQFWDRVCGFFLVTGIICGCAGLTLEYVLVKGPSENIRDVFVNTMNESRRFKFIPRIFLTEEEFNAIKKDKNIDIDIATNEDLIKLPTDTQQQLTEDGKDAYGLVDDDGDGIIYQEIRRGSFAGNMIVILDPKRVFVGMPDDYGGVGLTLEEMCLKYDAIGGINAGGFKDDGGTGLGGLPQGLTIVDGYCYNDEAFVVDGFAGFDKNGLLHVGWYTYDDCVEKEIVNAVSFGPILISNGVPTDPEYLTSGVNPRTAIGQRADGAVIMLVIDGRQVHSAGATYQDVVDLMLDYGAVNACNMDGGSSTVMWYDGRYVNKCSAAYGVSRPLPTAFLFK